VDVEPRQLYCKYLCVFFFDFDNKKKYFLREGESSIEYTELKKLLPKVQENANRFYNFFLQLKFCLANFSLSMASLKFESMASHVCIAILLLYLNIKGGVGKRLKRPYLKVRANNYNRQTKKDPITSVIIDPFPSYDRKK
jgi:hypothetical protein